MIGHQERLAKGAYDLHPVADARIAQVVAGHAAHGAALDLFLLDNESIAVDMYKAQISTIYPWE
jgi:hypothetical protein